MDSTVFHLITGILAGLSLLGVGLLTKKKWEGWVVLLFANAGWAIIDYICHVPIQTALHIVFFGMALWGLWEWHYKNRKQPGRASAHRAKFKRLQTRVDRRIKEREKIRIRLCNELLRDGATLLPPDYNMWHTGQSLRLKAMSGHNKRMSKALDLIAQGEKNEKAKT